MSVHEIAIDEIKKLSHYDVCKIISFARFLQNELNQHELILEPDDEEEIIRIMEEDDWVSSDVVEKRFLIHDA
jgi:transcription initiation factor TFIIIB Brf1 subunit/transcription initiation factor TFIIB